MFDSRLGFWNGGSCHLIVKRLLQNSHSKKGSECACTVKGLCDPKSVEKNAEFAKRKRAATPDFELCSLRKIAESD
jgi:hypothetical protein